MSIQPRLRLLTTVALLAASAAFPANAQDKVLHVAAYGGFYEQLIREQIFPDFEKQHGVRIEYTAGNPTDTLARLVATQYAPQIDVAIMDDGPMYQAIALGLCRDVEPAAVYDDLYDMAKVSGGKATGLGAVATGFMYDTQYFQEQGWAAPTS